MMKHIVMAVALLVCGRASAINIAVLNTMAPYDLFGLIERLKIAAFSTDSFTRAGLDEQNVAQWNELTYALADIVKQVAMSSGDYYTKIVTHLHTVRDYIEETIGLLHAHQPTQVAYGQRYWVDMHMLQDEMFQEIRRTTKPGKEWIQAIPHGQILTATHLQIVKDFKRMAKLAMNDDKPLGEHEIVGLLKLHHVHSKLHVKVLIDNLEQYCYRKGKYAEYARRLVQELRSVYPEILSNYDLSVLANTQDKVHTILFAQAGAYENILHQLLREMYAA